MVKLPDFDTMMQLHREDPEALERLRQDLTSELVNNASEETKRRLEGLQFRINMELRRAGNPTARFLKLSGMMQDAFSELNYCLNSPLDAIAEKQKSQSAVILPLFGKTAGQTLPSKH
ncbi:MAG: DUF3135 domain-containing protein [Pseudohongiella sp.]|nr:DUF3135 domain-containing protein [Pseudohongiella sp.]MDP2285853.1 DUF3135 domain-containing protein [Pseudohongiella sp.]MDP3517205.1 DUF3135 domain-containing protein [Pseudohongiella sp.]